MCPRYDSSDSSLGHQQTSRRHRQQQASRAARRQADVRENGSEPGSAGGKVPIKHTGQFKP